MGTKKKQLSNFNLFKSISDKEKGFTLIEAVFALLILILSLSLVSTAVQQLDLIHQQMVKNNQLEWHLFLNQFEYEASRTIFQTTDGKKAEFKKYNEESKKLETISYFKMKDKEVLIRQVDGKGYQPMLLNVQQLSYTVKNRILYLSVDFNNQEHYKGLVRLKIAEQPQEAENE
ncbi:competence type IV pilus minor pilin ComGF [Pisciglobus halotolerans]|uniref:Competence protein ComGF n=1 Tax=Pisciglobus halotolerans TaxID=745365 RepID=A0A1I3CWD3_9LACT|nr:competence type IV pilus minor pilin ComGF [Pisciglobus halotolerans]SFH78658.1 competence protein ComGF [Pisciglobus halotolerans]